MIRTRQKPAREPRQWTGRTPDTSPSACRMATTAATMSVPLPKDRPARSEEYRRLVAALPCAYCKRTGYSQAAHPNGLSAGKGRGIKADDRLCFPLCCDGYAADARGCHWLFDNYTLIRRAHRDEWAALMAAETRAQIERDGKWPKRLAKWDK